MDIPDDLYRRLKVQSAARGLSVRNVLLGLIEDWLATGSSGPGAAAHPVADISNEEQAARLRAFLDETAAEVARAPEPASLSELLAASRNRLEPGS